MARTCAYQTVGTVQSTLNSIRESDFRWAFGFAGTSVTNTVDWTLPTVWCEEIEELYPIVVQACCEKYPGLALSQTTLIFERFLLTF